MSQTTRIYGHLTRGPLTPLQALKCYGVLRLASRILELRERGHDIRTDIVALGGKKVAQYSMKTGNGSGAIR